MAHDTFVQDGKLLYETDIDPLNNSGVSGRAVLLIDLNDQSLIVDIEAEGLEPGQVHIQHIHGFEDDTDSKVPTIAQDDDTDGFVELAEGLETYGPILLNLSLNPEDSLHDRGEGDHDHADEAEFPTVGDDGVLDYQQTFRFDADDPNAQAIFDSIKMLEAKEIVLHGLSVAEGQGEGTDMEVDGTAGYKLVLPVAAGELTGIAPARDVLDAVQELGLPQNDVVDWNAIAAEATANFEATGTWYI